MEEFMWHLLQRTENSTYQIKLYINELYAKIFLALLEN